VCNRVYPDFAKALLERGWFENPERDSRFFDLQWGLGNDVHHDRLEDHQVVNHFQKCQDLTTKVGLSLNLRQSTWLSGVDSEEFYPRAYDLYDPLERADFVQNFKLTKAEAILRQFLQHLESQAEHTFSPDVVGTALKVCTRRVTDVDDVIDCPEICESLGSVTSSEWDLLQTVSLDDVTQKLEGLPKAKDMEDMVQKKTERQREKEQKIREKEEAEAKALMKAQGKAPKSKKKKKQEVVVEDEPLFAPLSVFDNARGRHVATQARETLDELRATGKQIGLNGARNAWIIKPSGKSRGRGIQVMRELTEIFKTTEAEGNQWICQKYIEQPQLVHGYKFDIRQWVLVTDWNPLTIYIWKQPYFRFAGQKYDETMSTMSSYVHLVNNSIIKYMDGFEVVNEDLNTSGYMWFRQQYEEYIHPKYCKRCSHCTPFITPPPYTCEYYGVNWEDVKFTANEDSDSDAEDPEGPPPAAASAPAAPQASRAAEPPPRQPAAEADPAAAAAPAAPDQPPAPSPAGADAGDGGAHSGEPCEDIWETCIFPQIKDIVIWSLLTVVDGIQHRKGSVQLYGYDFMIADGEKPEVWLIEVNSSPACDYSTRVTTPLVKKMMEDTAKIMVDLKEDPLADTGEWELLDHAFNKQVVGKTHCRDKLEVIGTHIAPPKGFKKKKKKKKKKAKEKAVSGAGSAAPAPESGDDESEGDGDGDDDDASDGDDES